MTRRKSTDRNVLFRSSGPHSSRRVPRGGSAGPFSMTDDLSTCKFHMFPDESDSSKHSGSTDASPARSRSNLWNRKSAEPLGRPRNGYLSAYSVLCILTGLWNTDCSLFFCRIPGLHVSQYNIRGTKYNLRTSTRRRPPCPAIQSFRGKV